MFVVLLLVVVSVISCSWMYCLCVSCSIVIYCCVSVLCLCSVCM
jgi:hypothetical protein